MKYINAKGVNSCESETANTEHSVAERSPRTSRGRPLRSTAYMPLTYRLSVEIYYYTMQKPSYHGAVPSSFSSGPFFAKCSRRFHFCWLFLNARFVLPAGLKYRH